MSVWPDLDIRLQALAKRYYNSLEDQLYEPDPRVDGYGKERQKQYIVALLADLAREATALVTRGRVEE